jgi:hypothetical protein
MIGSRRLWVAQKYHFFKKGFGKLGRLLVQFLEIEFDVVGPAGFEVELFDR